MTRDQSGIAPITVVLVLAIVAVGGAGIGLALTRAQDPPPEREATTPSPTVAPTPSPSPSPADRDTPRETRTPQFRRCQKTANRLQDIADELADVWVTTVNTVNRTEYINVNTGEAVQALKTLSARLEVLRARLKPLRIPSRLAAPERLLRRSLATAERGTVLLLRGFDEVSTSVYQEGADLVNRNLARVRAFARKQLTLRCARILGAAAND